MRHDRKKKVVLAFLTVSLVGCAKVSVTPINPDGTARSGVDGVRVAAAKPYLIVAALPASTANSTTSTNLQRASPNTSNANSSGQTDTSQQNPSSAAGGSSDTGFQATSPQYVMKLVYLPDYANQYAISESPGLFGSTEMKPQLQDGWMLVSLDATGDSKTAETLTAVASLVSGALGGGAGKAAGSAASAAQGANRALNQAVQSQSLADNQLQPGLYEFSYNSAGSMVGLRRITGFCGGTGIYATPEISASRSAGSSLPDKCAAQSAVPVSDTR